MTLKINYANTFFSRLKGLMFKKSMPENEGLLIIPCNQVHTFNMKFPIDIIYISNDNIVIDIDENINKGRVCKLRKEAHSVLELNAGSAKKLNINKNDFLKGIE